jgi:hypothetical protein
MYTSVGFNAGDYVYQYGANLVGWPKGNTVDLGIENTAIAGATYVGYAQTGVNSRLASPGPFVTSTAYTGTTKTVGGIAVSPTVLSGAAFASGSVRCATLTDGRIAYAYRTASATLVTAIYTAAGVLQGSVTTVSTTVGFTLRNFSMVALSDGGFIVGYYNSTSTNNFAARLNSSNSITSNVQIVGGNNASFQVAASQNFYAFSYHLTDGSGNPGCSVFSMATNSFTGSTSFTSENVPYNTCVAGTNADSFIVVVSGSNENNTAYRITSGGAQAGTRTNMGGSVSTSGSMSAACGTTQSPTTTAIPAAWFVYPDGANQPIIARIFLAAGATNLSFTTASIGLASTAVAIGSINSGGCVVVYRRGTSDLRYNTYNAAVVSQSAGALVTGNIADVSIGASGVAGGTFAFAYGAVTTGFSTFGAAYSATYTNGVTVITDGISYTPAGGYYLLGVALTTAAAGTTGAVAINGSANLGASYPVLTSNILFDYTGTTFTARSAINANRGNVIGTNVTLRGLE